LIIHIAKHSETNNENRRNLVKAENSIITLQSEIETLDVQKKKVEYKNKIELNRDRLEVEVAGLRNTAVSKKNDLNKYNLNLKAIELNTKIDIDLSKVKTDIAVTEYAKDDALLKIQKVDNEHQAHVTNIESKTKIISTIEKENEVDKLFKVYIEIVGKKGISKLVLRSVLPIINSETQRLLEDVCNFEVEIFIDDKNEVQFLINEDDVTKQLKSGSGFEKTVSSLALRAVLGKLSILPMPNFITFDEVMGKVANDNLEKLKPLFEKIKDMYEIVFLITHNDLVKDWSENLITVVKDNHLSKISFKK
jgi:DNA repair exonuclease SbcCD ATPase subunit